MKHVWMAGMLAMTTATAGAQSRDALIGCWTMNGPHGQEGLSLLRNGRFYFNDWNSRRGQFETLDGRWTFNRNSITLLYTDRSKQSFMIKRDRRNRWMLTKAGGFMLYKGDPSECNER